MPNDLTPETVKLLLLAGALACLTQLSRQLARPRLSSLRRVLALSLAAGLAALAADGLLLAWVAPGHSLLLAVGLTVGWTGPSVLERLEVSWERRYGLRPPERDG